MKGKKIIYWALTSVFCLANFASGVAGFFPSEQGAAVMAQLGYPGYIMLIIGVAKILGSIAVIQSKFRTIKEWAYAGFTIDYIGASASFYFSGSSVGDVMFPMIFLGVMFASYYLWKKTDVKKK
jgi:hypothetical protein